MKKKFLALLLATASIFTSNIFAEEIDEVKAKSCSVFFNGQDMGEIEDFFHPYHGLKYTEIASILGYETTYDDDTRTITSVKDDEKLVIPIDSDSELSILKTSGDETTEIAYVYSSIYNDRFYIYEWNYERLFDVKVNLSYDDANDKEEYHIIETAPLKKYMLEKTVNFEKYIDIVGVSSFPNQSSEGMLECVFDSPNFGTKIEGSCSISSNQSYNNGKLSMSIDANTAGIINVITAALQGAAGMELQNMKFDLTKPIDFNMYSDETGTYLKSDMLHGLLLSGILGYNNTPEFKKNVFDSTLGKYIRYDSELVPEEMAENINAITNTYEVLIDLLVEMALNAGIAEYDRVIAYIDSIIDLVDEEHLIINEKADGSTNVTYKVTENDIVKIVNAVIDDTYLNIVEREQINKFLNGMNVECLSVCNITKSGKMTTKSNIEFVMEIPNNWNLDIGTLTFKLKSTGTADSDAVELTPPDDGEFVNYTDIEEESILDSEKYYEEIYYTPDAESDKVFEVI